MGLSTPAGSVVVAVLVGLAGGLAEDPVRSLAWVALVSAPTGVLVGAGIGKRGGWPWLLAFLVAPVSWCFLPRAPDPAGAASLWTALHLLGGALGRLGPARGLRSAGELLVLVTLLAALPSLGGVAGAAPWSPEVAARLLDLAPTSWVIEAGGYDWMRHAAVYEPVGTSAIGPDLRQAYRPDLAERGVLLVLCGVLCLFSDRLRPRPGSIDRE